MDSKKLAPLNLSELLKKVFLFFCISFVFFFAIFTIGQFFDFLGRQLAIFERQAIVLGEELPITPDVLLSTSGVDAFSDFVFTQKENSLEIQKLGVEAPIIFSKSANIKEITKDLLRGVAAYPGSNSPGEKGKMFILGHSAPPGFPKLKYYWVFSKLNDLETGDEIFINFENKQYRYQVTQKIFLEKGGEIPVNENGSQQFIYLITCWPPGQDVRRLAVEAVLTD